MHPRRWYREATIRGISLPIAQSRLAKVVFERYYLWKVRNGYVHLP